ncbi:MAG: hypothetical protein IIA45_12925 [Bacteroidetes bacterium]|nr:hypothetical protein [Bacteroidota bacterium]
MSIAHGLTSSEKEVLMLYLGVGKEFGMTLMEIGSIIGVSKEEALRLRDSALNKAYFNLMKIEQYMVSFKNIGNDDDSLSEGKLSERGEAMDDKAVAKRLGYEELASKNFEIIKIFFN